MAVDMGTGTTITWGTSTFTALIRDIDHSGQSLSKHKTSDQSTTGTHTYIMGKLKEGGSFNVDFLFDSSLAVKLPPLGAAAETITVTYPDGGKEAFSGAVGSYGKQVPYDDDIMKGSMVIEVLGPITYTPPV